jgi:hypothetical protein
MQDHILEHYLPEPALSFSIDKKNIDSYKLKNEMNTKKIDIKDYKISIAESVKSLYSEIETKVLKNSESTYEIKPTDYQKVLDQIILDKAEANEIIKVNLDGAIAKYRQTLFDIEEHTRALTDKQIDENKIIREIFYQKKLILSNLALCNFRKKNYRETIDLDLYILSIDKQFEKSYLRLVSCYSNTGNLDNANYYANQMKLVFGTGIVNKHWDFFKDLEQKNNQADESLKKLSKRSQQKKQESEIISEIGDDENNKKKNQQIATRGEEGFFGRVFKFILGSSLLIFSSGVLFYLYKNKNKYTV